MGSGSGSGRHLLVGGWVESTCFPLKEGLQYLPPTRARACVCACECVSECECACACVSEGTRLHSPNSFFFFFLLEASWWIWGFF